MSDVSTSTRREFVKVAGTAAIGASLFPADALAQSRARRRYAIVGTGDRGSGMWGRDLVRRYPDLRGTVTDLLIGDLFTDRVDKVWKPMEALYPPDKAAIPPWHAGTVQDAAPEKANELTLPDGRRP